MDIWANIFAVNTMADDCGMVVLHARHTRTTRTTHIGRCRLAISPMSFQGRTSHHCWPYRMDPIWSCWPYFSSRSRLPDLSMALSGGQHQQSVAIHVGFVQIDLCWGATRHLSDLSHQLFHGLLHSKQISTLAGCEDVNLIDLADDLKLHEEPETKIDHETHQHTHQDDTVIRNLHLRASHASASATAQQTSNGMATTSSRNLSSNHLEIRRAALRLYGESTKKEHIHLITGSRLNTGQHGWPEDYTGYKPWSTVWEKTSEICDITIYHPAFC